VATSRGQARFWSSRIAAMSEAGNLAARELSH
jgi:hypothetical protein